MQMGARSVPPGSQHWMGTDHLGRDMFSRVVHGSRVSMYVALLTMAIGLGAGIPLGLAAGYFQGMFDLVISRVLDLMMSFPVVILAMVITVVLGAGVTTVGVAVGVVYIPAFARLVRASALSLREAEFILAAQALGHTDRRILFCHILPNCMAPILVSGTVIMAYALIMEATLSFLGLGTQPPTPSWGSDLKMNLVYLELNPAATLFPGLAILVAVLGFNMLGDGLRDALDPKLRNRA
jgi:peptide/nickel transport system permease protein